MHRILLLALRLVLGLPTLGGCDDECVAGCGEPDDDDHVPDRRLPITVSAIIPRSPGSPRWPTLMI